MPRDAARAFAIPASTTFCRLAMVLIPLPSSAVAAMATSTAARFSVVTPIIPNAARSSAVSDGDAVPPAATMLRRLTMLAKVVSSAYVSMLLDDPTSAIAFSNNASAVVSITVRPRVWNWLIDKVAPPFATPSAAFSNAA